MDRMQQKADRSIALVNGSAFSPQVYLKDFESILARFEEYGFHDRIGLPLVNCEDFLELARRACLSIPGDVPA
jgi:hypothetical protein